MKFKWLWGMGLVLVMLAWVFAQLRPEVAGEYAGEYSVLQRAQVRAEALVETSDQLEQDALASVYQAAKAAAVRIETVPAGVGSGFVVDDDGLVMTAYHVVRDARALVVVTAEGARHPARVVGYDEYADLALLEIDAEGLMALPQAVGGAPAPGEALVAIGNSRGEFNAPRFGRVVALEQTLSASFPDHLIATTMPLAPGDSGGPVLNAAGEVVGVAVAISVSPEGFASFASPLYGAEASAILEELQSGVRRGVPFMGVSLLTLDPQVAAQLGYAQSRGLLVTEVVPGSGADQAGLEPPQTLQRRLGRRGRVVTTVTRADVIVAVDEHVVASTEELIAYLRGREVGDEVTLTVLRGDTPLSVTVKLGARDAPTSAAG